MSLTFSIVLYLFIFNSFLHISSPYLYLLHFGEIKFSACSLVVSALDRCRLLVIKRMIGLHTCTHQIDTYVFSSVVKCGVLRSNRSTTRCQLLMWLSLATTSFQTEGPPRLYTRQKAYGHQSELQVIYG